MPGPIESLDARIAYFDKLMDKFEERAINLTARLKAGTLSLQDWHITMRAELRRMHALALITAEGGQRKAVNDKDWLKLGPEMTKQYRYLERFAHDLQSGTPRVLQYGESRAAMYANSARATFWRQMTKGLVLPAQPGDGGTKCKTKCRCRWEIIEGQAYWRLGASEHCTTCLDRASAWNPYQGG